MANTTKGIYYPNEYNAPADVPKDMKELAESVDGAIENIETEQNTKINNLVTKNAQQDAQMENLNAKDISLEAEIQTLQSQNTQQTTEIELLKSENTILKSQIPSATVTGETIHLEDSSNMKCQIMPLGASIQEGTPSIEFEAPVESVGDNINSLGIQDGSWTENGLTINVKDNEININGTVTASANVFFALKESLNLNGKYSFQAGNNIALTGGEYFRLYTGTTGFEVLVAFGALTSLNVKSENIDISGTADRLAIRVNAGTVFNNVTFKPKLEKGTKATPYSPYGQGSVEVIQTNKNILTKQPNVYYNPTGLTVTDKQIGEFILNGTQKADELRFFGPYNTKKCNYELPKGRYKFLAYVSNKDGAIYTELTISDGSSYKQINGIAIEFEITKEGQGLGSIKVPIGSGTYNNVELKMMLIKSTDDETYVPHQGQIKALYTQQPFRAIGDVKDSFVKKDGVWYEEHPVTPIVLDGTESITQNTTYNYFTIIKDTTSLSLTNNNINKAKSNYGIVTTESLANTSNNERVSYGGASDGIGRVYIGAYGSEIDSVDKLKNKLSTTPMIIQGIAITPTLIECTPEQVEVLESFNTYKNVTNISSDSIGELEVTYSKDLETLYNNLNQAVLGGN